MEDDNTHRISRGFCFFSSFCWDVGIYLFIYHATGEVISYLYCTFQAIVTSKPRSGQLFDGNGSMPPTFLITFIAFLPQVTHQEHALTLL